MSHIQSRLAERGIEKLVTESECKLIASRCNTDTAIILTKLDSTVNDSSLGYYARTESNGDLVVLIVRNHNAVTIMYRRSNQPQTPANLKVNEVIDLTH